MAAVLRLCVVAFGCRCRSGACGSERVRDAFPNGARWSRSWVATRSSLRRDQRAAGRSSRRGEAEPHRACALRRSRRRDRRGTRDRLAAARHAAGGQSRDPAGQARLLRGRALRHAAREADAPRSRRGRRTSRRQSAHPDRSAQHRARSRRLLPNGSPSSIHRTRPTIEIATRRSPSAGPPRSRIGKGRPSR